MTPRVFPIPAQLPNHCGAASLAMCLRLLGFSATQRDVAKAAGKPNEIFLPGDNGGLEPEDLQKAAAAFGARCEFHSIQEKEQGDQFASGLRRHLQAGLPLILLIQDFGHWVAVVGHVHDKFVIMDPNDREHTFNRWSESTLLRRAWNDNGEDPPEYFAIRTSRADGEAPKWKVSKVFLRLCEVGAEETAEQMAKDLIEMVERAGAGQELDEEGGAPLEDVLSDHRKMIIDSVWHWTASDEVSRQAIVSVYDGYTTIAAATSLRFPAGANRTAMFAQLTAILTTYAWLGEL